MNAGLRRLPGPALTDDFWRDSNLARLLIYLMAKADDNGEVETSMTAVASDLRLSRQQLRTLMGKMKSNQILTNSATNRATKIKINYQEDKSKRQPRKQPTQQPKNNQLKTIVPDYISPSFVGEEYREIWQRFIEYRKEIKKPYRSESSERTAYFKMVEMAGGDPKIAKDMIERSILGQWQGLYKENGNGKRSNYPTNRVNPPRADTERVAEYQDLAEAIFRRVEARENS